MEIQPVKTHAPLASAPPAPGVAVSRQLGAPKPDPAAAAPDMTSAPAAARDVAPSDPNAPSPSTNVKELQEAIDKIEKVVQPVAQDLKFSIDEDTGKTVIKVIDTGTKEVIRQIPSEELIAIARALDKLQGLLVKQKV